MYPKETEDAEVYEDELHLLKHKEVTESLLKWTSEVGQYAEFTLETPLTSNTCQTPVPSGHKLSLLATLYRLFSAEVCRDG